MVCPLPPRPATSLKDNAPARSRSRSRTVTPEASPAGSPAAAALFRPMLLPGHPGALDLGLDDTEPPIAPAMEHMRLEGHAIGVDQEIIIAPLELENGLVDGHGLGQQAP